MLRDLLLEELERAGYGEWSDLHTRLRKLVDSQKVFVLIIDTDSGTDVMGLFWSAREAHQELYDWVKGQWPDYEQEYGPMPEDEDEAIEMYFEELEPEEWAIIEQVEL